MPIKFYRDPFTYISLGLGVAFWIIYIYLTQSSVPSIGAQIDTLMTKKWLIAGLIAPILEETFFRLGIQGYFLGRTWGKKRILGLSYANYLTSTLFCLSHILLRPGVPFSYLVFFPALVFGQLRDRQQNVWGCYLTHCFYNTGFLLYIS